MSLIGSVLNILLIALIIAAGYYALQTLFEGYSGLPKINTTNFTFNQEPLTNATLRWNHFPVTVYIDSNSASQNPKYADNVRSALEIWETSTNGLVSFLVVSDPANADITVTWVSNLKEKSTDTLGNTDLKFIVVGKYGVVQNAKIEMLTRSDSRQLSETDMTNLALHEVGHALGLSHSNDQNDIMYPVLTIPSQNIKQINQSDITELQKAYSVAAKPDLLISEANVTKATVKRLGSTYYLANISVVIENLGLLDSPASVIQIDADGTKVKQENLSSASVGTKINLILGNVRINSDFKTIRLILDPANSIDEMDEQNNYANLVIS